MTRGLIVGVAIAAVWTTGCIDPDTTRCGDLVCPVGKVCAPSHYACVLPGQVGACASADDGAACSFAGVSDGACDDGVCFAVGCGNGRLDPGEACDDGNTADLDGCSADCSSDETCGNGTVDPRRGEQCDDGNTVDGDGCQSTCLVPLCGDLIVDPGEECDDGNFVDGDGCNMVCTSDETCGNGWTDFGIGEQCDDGAFSNHDGCSSQCTAELPLWLEQDVSRTVGFRQPVMVYDARRDVVVSLFGSGPLGEPLRTAVRELTGGAWHEVDDGGVLPPPRVGHAAVYDAARGVIVLFGGGEPVAAGPGIPPMVSERHGDTWHYDGRAWTEVVTTPSPGPRTGIAAAYDAGRARVVLFGGETDAGVVGETWEYDGATWVQRFGAEPPARTGHTMAYDASRQRVVLFGGTTAAGDALEDTWEYDGATWVETTPAQVPTARGVMAYDAARAVTVLFGGDVTGSSAVWEYDGATWVESTAVGPAPRVHMGMAYDPRRRAMVLGFGGTQTSGPTVVDTWLYDGAFSELSFVFEPGRRIEHASAYDSLRGRMLMFGGVTPNPPGALDRHNDLWTYVRGRWREERDVNAPPPSLFASMVFDRARGVAIAVLAVPGDTALQTWELSGLTWRQVATASPPQRTRFSLAYDPVRARAVLFGGSAGPGAALADTWEYDGAAWTEMSPASAPAPRLFAMTAFHGGIGKVVLFGGSAGPNQFGDTWTYDGTTWSEVAFEPDDERPSPRGTESMDYYAPRKAIVLFGGDPLALNDTWEFDGSKWHPLTTPQLPEPRRAPMVRYDERNKSMLMSGGDPTFDTWEMRYSSTVPDELCGDGVDQDGDGAIDCADADCEGMPCGGSALVCSGGSCVCAGGASETLCNDEFDDDCDGAVDCDDSDCATSAFCGAEANCADGADDDGDGFADCADVGCDGVGACEAVEVTCDDGVDNDGDGDVDCADLNCYLNPCPELL